MISTPPFGKWAVEMRLVTPQCDTLAVMVHEHPSVVLGRQNLRFGDLVDVFIHVYYITEFINLATGEVKSLGCIVF